MGSIVAQLSARELENQYSPRSRSEVTIRLKAPPAASSQYTVAKVSKDWLPNLAVPVSDHGPAQLHLL
jgi:hypothetical protein